MAPRGYLPPRVRSVASCGIITAPAHIVSASTVTTVRPGRFQILQRDVIVPIVLRGEIDHVTGDVEHKELFWVCAPIRSAVTVRRQRVEIANRNRNRRGRVHTPSICISQCLYKPAFQATRETGIRRPRTVVSDAFNLRAGDRRGWCTIADPRPTTSSSGVTLGPRATSSTGSSRLEGRDPREDQATAQAWSY